MVKGLLGFGRFVRPHAQTGGTKGDAFDRWSNARPNGEGRIWLVEGRPSPRLPGPHWASAGGGPGQRSRDRGSPVDRVVGWPHPRCPQRPAPTEAGRRTPIYLAVITAGGPPGSATGVRGVGLANGRGAVVCRLTGWSGGCRPRPPRGGGRADAPYPPPLPFTPSSLRVGRLSSRGLAASTRVGARTTEGPACGLHAASPCGLTRASGVRPRRGRLPRGSARLAN